MSNKKKYSLLASTAAVAFILAACGGTSDSDTDNGNDANGNNDDKEEVVDEGDAGNGEQADGPSPIEFEQTLSNEGDPIEGGTLAVGFVSDSPFTGIFSSELYSGNPDAVIMGYMAGTLLGYDENYQYNDSGAASIRPRK